jgi:hypothetical protein
MLTIQYAKDPIYADAEGTTIQLTVKFEEMDDEIPFGATPWDTEPYGVELHNNAVAGIYGPIAPYVPPPSNDQPVTSGTQEF